ncbi:MAG: AMP-binding protein [Aquabacterium sp.]
MLPTFDPLRTSLVTFEVATATHASPAMLAHWQTQRLAALLRAARGSAVYRPYLEGLRDADVALASLPVIPKRELMGRFEEWVTDPDVRLADVRAFIQDPARIADPYLGRYTVWESSGSSGEPGIFLQDAAAMAVYDAIESQRRPALRPMQRLLDPFGLSDRFVFVGAVNGHFASTVSVERIRRLNPAMAPGLKQVSFLQPVADMLAELQALAPTAIATYPSVALLLAEAQLAGRLDLRPLEIWTGGETLTPAVRCRVRQAFHCPVLNTYGSSEFLSLAFECRHGHLHLNSDWAILESVDEHGRPVPAGQPGVTSLLTNLANHVQPIIRYDIGDSVTLHDTACACGSPLPVIEVLGRDEDILHIGPHDEHGIDVTPLALSTVLETDAGLYDFQLVQEGPTRLVLKTGRQGEQAQDALGHARQVLADFLSHQGARGVHIDCRCGEAALRSRSGKVKRVVGLTA